MKHGEVIKIKVDNRFKDGNIRKEGDTLRGNAMTVSVVPISLVGAPPEVQLNPPLTVSSAMFEAMQKAGYLRRNK